MKELTFYTIPALEKGLSMELMEEIKIPRRLGKRLEKLPDSVVGFYINLKKPASLIPVISTGEVLIIKEEGEIDI